MFFSKLSHFLLFRKIFEPKRYMVWLIYFGIFFAFGTYLTIIPLSTYYCAPRNGQTWVTAQVDCAKELPYAIVQGCLNIVLDVYLLVLPIPVIWKLNLSPRRKAEIVSIFAIGIM